MMDDHQLKKRRTWDAEKGHYVFFSSYDGNLSLESFNIWRATNILFFLKGYKYSYYYCLRQKFRLHRALQFTLRNNTRNWLEICLSRNSIFMAAKIRSNWINNKGNMVKIVSW